MHPLTEDEKLRAFAILEDAETAPIARQRLLAEVLTPPVVERLNKWIGLPQAADAYVTIMMRAWVDANRRVQGIATPPKQPQWV